MPGKRKSLVDVARGFGQKHREMQQRFQAAVAAAPRLATVAAAQAAAVPVVKVPKGAAVTLTIDGSGINAVVILDHVILPQQPVYVLQLNDGPNNLAWVVTPVQAPWAFAVNLDIAGTPPQQLDRGAGTTVGDPVANQVMLDVA